MLSILLLSSGVQTKPKCSFHPAPNVRQPARFHPLATSPRNHPRSPSFRQCSRPPNLHCPSTLHPPPASNYNLYLYAGIAQSTAGCLLADWRVYKYFRICLFLHLWGLATMSIFTLYHCPLPEFCAIISHTYMSMLFAYYEVSFYSCPMKGIVI